MGVTNNFSANGRLLGESGPNGSVDYLTDALGSVVTTVNQTGTVLNTYRYKPYGAHLSRTGTAPDPRFLWVGSRGYRQTGLTHSGSYVRARHLGTADGRWSVVDPRWPTEPAYTYAGGNPSSITDPSGLVCLPKLQQGSAKHKPYPSPKGCGSTTGGMATAISTFCNCMNSQSAYNCVLGCVQASSCSAFSQNAKRIATCMKNWCTQGSLSCCPQSQCPGACSCAPISVGPTCKVCLMPSYFSDPGCASIAI